MPAYRKKLIEVDLPLDFIKRESTNSKGHPAHLHKWWARRPLTACRAVIFSSMVDDPSSCPEEFPTLEDQVQERRRLHDLISRLMIWKNSNDEKLLNEARYEIARSVARSHSIFTPPPPDTDVLNFLAENAPEIHDPFAGGGSIPLEAQRLGLKAVGSDLNPIAVLINKAQIEIPPKFANRPPINPDAERMGMTVGKARRSKRVPWHGAAGLAHDIRYYGQWIREHAYQRIGHLYPKVELINGREADVIGLALGAHRSLP